MMLYAEMLQMKEIQIRYLLYQIKTPKVSSHGLNLMQVSPQVTFSTNFLVHVKPVDMESAIYCLALLLEFRPCPLQLASTQALG